ncbi:hypothetical protein F750_0154 [Streptomyces sp. PAMC 26508]|nr:hypothetical protein F750_0154 [Streptomyces sp. PAMC 26508]
MCSKKVRSRRTRFAVPQGERARRPRRGRGAVRRDFEFLAERGDEEEAGVVFPLRVRQAEPTGTSQFGPA